MKIIYAIHIIIITMDSDTISLADNFSSQYGDDDNGPIDNSIMYDIEIAGIKINKAIIKGCRKNPTQEDLRVLTSILRETLELYSMYHDHDFYCMKILYMLLTVRSHSFLKSIVTIIRLEHYQEYDKMMQRILLNKMKKYHLANKTSKNIIYLDIEYLFSVANQKSISGSVIEFIQDDKIDMIYTLEELLGDYFDDYIDDIVVQVVFNGAKDVFTYMHNKYGPFKDIEKLVGIYIESVKTIFVRDNILVVMKQLGYKVDNYIEDCILWITTHCNQLNNYNINFHINSLMGITKNKKLPYMMMGNIIANNNYNLVQQFATKYFSHLSNVRFFCMIAKWENNIIEMFIENTKFEIEEMDDIFIKICMSMHIRIAQILRRINPYRYHLGINNDKLEWFDIDYDMKLHPIIYDNMIPNMIEEKGECTVCYDEVSDYIVLPCHDTHIVCTSCFIRMVDNKTCPMCRAGYDMSNCKLQCCSHYVN